MLPFSCLATHVPPSKISKLINQMYVPMSAALPL